MGLVVYATGEMLIHHNYNGEPDKCEIWCEVKRKVIVPNMYADFGLLLLF